ncbi:hypothetical protein B0H17DRAFT_866854, partial [Mycena rosella]
DSTGPFFPPKCHPDTRRETLDTLYRWASEITSGSGNILWLQGPMGAGKSTILHTLTQRLHAAGRFGGGFIFPRKYKTRGNANTLFCAIAYQLATNIPRLRAPISQAVRRNPGIVGERFSIQLEELILEPFRAVVDLNPLTLVIDGLDQCQLEVQQEILCLLGTAAQSQPSQLRILIVSTSEDCIAEILAEPCFNGICRSFDVERSLGDVRTYLAAEFTGMPHTCVESTGGGGCITSPRLSPDVFNRLIESSSGCFLYASTLIRFLGDAKFCPLARLTDIVESLPLNPLNSPVDNLYSQILA